MKKLIKQVPIISIFLFFITFTIISCDTDDPLIEEELLNEESKNLGETDDRTPFADISVSDEEAVLTYLKKEYELAEFNDEEIEKLLEEDLQTIKEMQKLLNTKILLS